MNWNIAKIYAYSFFDDLLFIYPLYAVMFVDSGVSAFQISILLIVWSTVAFVLEVPSGAVADTYSRKHILFFGQIVRALGLLTWILYPNFIGFLVGFILWGFESAFSSGTFQALVYDELKSTKDEAKYAQVIGRSRSLKSAGQIIAALGASAAIMFGYPFVLAISIGSTIISAAIIILLPRAAVVQSTGERQYWHTLRSGITEAIRNRSIFRIILFLTAGLALSGALDEYWSIYAKDVGLQNYAIAILMAGWGIFTTIGSLVAHRLENLPNSVFYVLFVIAGALLCIAGFLYHPIGLLLLLLFSLMFEIIDIVFETKLQHMLPHETRATIFSVNSFFVEIGAIGVYLVFGSIAEYFSYQYSFIAFGVLVTIIGLIYLVNNFYRNSQSHFLD